MEPESNGQSSAEEATALKLRTMSHGNLRQVATSETNACNVLFRLLGLSKSIVEFHRPDFPFRTGTIENDLLEELPSTAIMFQNKYLLRDLSGLNFLFGVYSFYRVLPIRAGCGAHLKNHIKNSLRQ